MGATAKENPVVTVSNPEGPFVSPASWALKELAQPGHPLPEVRVQFGPNSTIEHPLSGQGASERQLRHSA